MDEAGSLSSPEAPLPGQSNTMTNLRDRTAKGAAWMVAVKLIDRGCGVLSMVVLARLLVPADFGVVAMATSVTGMLQLLRSFSFDVPLIQDQTSGRAHYDTAFTLNIAFALALGAVLVALAYPAALFYREPRLTAVIPCLAISFVLAGFENIGVVAFRKDLEFHKEFLYMASPRLASLVAIPLAFVWKSYWALICGMVAGAVIRVALSYLMQSYRPRLSLAKARELLHFSKWLLFNNLICFFNEKSPDLVIGRLAGAQMVGVFSLSYELSNTPTTELAAPANRALFPAYAKAAGDRARLKGAYLMTLSVIAIITLPAACGIAAVADLLVRVMLGSNWLETIPVIQILAVYGFLYSIYTNTTYVHLAMGRPRILTALYVLQFVVMIPATILLVSSYGAIGGAMAFVITAAIVVPVGFAVLMRVLRMGLGELLSRVYRPALAGFAMYAIVRGLSHMLTEAPMAAPIALATQVLVGVAAYVLLVLGLWALARWPDGAESWLLELMRSRGPFRRPAAPAASSR